MAVPKGHPNYEKWYYKITHPTKEHNENNSIALKKFWDSEEGQLLKKKRSEERSNKPRPKHVMEKLLACNIGRKHTQEHIRKVAEKNLGRVPHNKGKIKPEYRIRVFFQRLPQRITNKQMALIIASENFSGVNNPMYGKKRPEIAKLMAESMSKRKFPFRNTKPERMMQLALKIWGINFETHRVISTGKFWHCVDIFIEPNICVEVDGKYWHTLPKNAKRDVVVNHELTIAGYHVVRIWDSDIYKDSNSCAKRIMSLINKKLESKI